MTGLSVEESIVYQESGLAEKEQECIVRYWFDREDCDQVISCSGWSIERTIEFFEKLGTPILFRRLMPGSPGFIYVINSMGTDLYKIGIAKEIPRRLNDLVRQSPYPLELVWSFLSNNTFRAERILHKHFEDRRTNGEWFRLNKSDIDWLASLRNEPPYKLAHMNLYLHS